MLLADILARDANSITVDACIASISIAHPSKTAGDFSRPQICTSQKYEWERNPTSLMDLPDHLILRILHWHFDAPRRDCRIRLVNKRLAMLAPEVFLNTISVRTSNDLLGLIFAPLSPLYCENLGKHVRCFELAAFFLQDYPLLGLDYDVPLALPNLETVRFRFTLGVPINVGGDINTRLSEDTVRRAIRAAADGSPFEFLSRFNPKKFEWVSDDPAIFRLVGLHTGLRVLFQSWGSLTSIYLEGLCLVEQPDMATWSLAFPADRTHIRGASIVDPSFLCGLLGTKSTGRCQMLLLEALVREDSSQCRQCIRQEASTPVAALGPMMIALKGWSLQSRGRFIDVITRKYASPYFEPTEPTLPEPLQPEDPISLDDIALFKILANKILHIICFIILFYEWNKHDVSSKLLELYPPGTSRYLRDQLYLFKAFYTRLLRYQGLGPGPIKRDLFNFVPT